MGKETERKQLKRKIALEEFNRDHVTTEIGQRILPKLARRFPEVNTALTPRPGITVHDVDIAYYATWDYLPSTKSQITRHYAISLDIILRNQRVPLEKRREIVHQLENRCRKIKIKK